MAALEELDLNEGTIRVIGSCIPSGFDSSTIKHSLNWHQELNDIILKESGDYYTLFPICNKISSTNTDPVAENKVGDFFDESLFDDFVDDRSYY